MTITQFIRARKIIARVAKRQGISTAQCRAEMTEAIHAAWATTDPETKDRQIRLIGEVLSKWTIISSSWKNQLKLTDFLNEVINANCILKDFQ